MLIYEITQTIFNEINEAFPSKNIGYVENSKYYIEEIVIDRLTGNGINLNQYFINKFSKSAKSYLEPFAIYPYRVYELVNEDFKNYHIENVNFKHHLKSDIALIKQKPTFDDRERPIEVDYKDEDGRLIARCKFEFELEPITFFPKSKKVYLAYYRENDTLGDYFLIENEQYIDEHKVFDELITARKNRIKKIKALVIKNYQVSDPTKSFPEILIETALFFKTVSKAVNLFEETGIAYIPDDPDFLVNQVLILSQEVNGVLKYPFLNHPFYQDNSLTLEQVIISQVIY